MDKNGNLFFGMLNPLAVACWVSAKFVATPSVPFNLAQERAQPNWCCFFLLLWLFLFFFSRSGNMQDSRTDYNQQNIKIVAQNDETLQFVTGMKVLTNGNGEEELWILTNRFQVSNVFS